LGPLKEQLKNELKSELFSESSNFKKFLSPKNFIIQKKNDTILTVLQISQKSSYLFFLGALSFTLLYFCLIDVIPYFAPNFGNTTYNENFFNLPCTAPKVVLYGDNMIKNFENKKFQKTRWFLHCLKLYHFNLLTPTLFLNSNYCFKVFEKHKKNVKEDNVTLETITYDFIIFRSSLIKQIKAIIFNCYLLGFSQLVFNCVAFVISFMSKFSVFAFVTTQLNISFLSSNPWVACFIGYLLFLVNKTISQTILTRLMISTEKLANKIQNFQNTLDLAKVSESLGKVFIHFFSIFFFIAFLFLLCNFSTPFTS
jgi:hypothetical protein